MSDAEVLPAPPATLGGVVANLEVEGAMKASDFYQRAFGAEQVFHHPVDDQGRTMHVHLHLNGSSLMLADAYPEEGHPHQPAQGYSLMLPVTDIEAAYERAVNAGAEAIMPPQKMFWGDTYGQLRDPFGVTWAMNQGA
ncbi:MAG: glyoxalase/bleomycin resistance/extradiol dioxygenase family protein [Phenylobacterium sp.]